MGGVGVEEYWDRRVVRMGGERVHVEDCWDGTLLCVDFQDCLDEGKARRASGNRVFCCLICFEDGGSFGVWLAGSAGRHWVGIH